MGHLYHGYVSHYQRVLRFGTMACDNSSEGEKTSSSCHVFGIYCGLNELKHGGQPTFFFTFSWRTASKSDLYHKLSMKIHGKRDQWPLLGTLEVYLPCIYIYGFGAFSGPLGSMFWVCYDLLLLVGKRIEPM